MTIIKFVFILLLPCLQFAQDIHGDLIQFHKVTIEFKGPVSSETAEMNPFTDYRLDVIFKGPGGKSYQIPGFFAADGSAAETSASAGNIWRVNFVPDREGEWQFQASFRSGPNIAVSLDPAEGSEVSLNATSGKFNVSLPEKNIPDSHARGFLCYTGEHYLRYSGTGEYFLKGGADSPENFLAYSGFDDTYDADAGSGSYSSVGTFIHHYTPHLKDWQAGNPTWQGEKGKEIIGMLNYLAGKGMNSVYFITYNLDGGDGRDIWMWTSPETRDRFDCSKLDQWEIIFDHMDNLGIMLHIVTQETENDHALGGSPGLNPVRMLYYRELIARFGHHLAIMWNLGEENNTSDSDRKEIARYIRTLDAYKHPITFHTHSNKIPSFYEGIFGDPFFEASSNQGNMDLYNKDAIILRQRTANAGRKWAIFGDEQTPAGRGVLPDENDPAHDLPRKQALWGNLMGGGSGVEWYFGHEFPHMDINCEDWRSREKMWDQTSIALEFFRKYLPFERMEPANELTSNPKDYCFANPGEIYAIYLSEGGSTEITIGEGIYKVLWFDPRNGGDLQLGSVKEIKGPGVKSIGHPPTNKDNDWSILVRRAEIK